MSGTEPQALAQLLARAAGLARPRTVERLAGGKNNRVFRVDLADGQTAVLKSYHFDPRDSRDRLGAEWSFLGYVWARGVRNVPRPLALSAEYHAGLYSFVDGRRATAVDEALLRHAIDFVAAINGPPHVPATLAPASEACFSLADHVAMVARRVDRLSDLANDAPHVERARRLVAERIKPAWRAVSERIDVDAKAAGVVVAKPVAKPIVSPSDFGFHNALVADDGAVSFIDFEYAGQDDPAKLLCDFFCQPEVPVPISSYDTVVGQVADSLKLDQEDVWRCRLLLDAYRVKWACIILNDFLPLGASRRAFADQNDPSIRAVRQIERAERQISLIRM